MALNLPSDGQLVTPKTGKWTTAMWAWMRDLSAQAASSGTVTSVTGSSPIVSSGGATPNISHAVSGVTAATYGDATHVAQVAINATGHVTSASNVVITSGLNQLTGDVTAGPGSGSQVATIGANKVTSAMLRQGVATSVIGRSVNSTGNEADIAASADQQILGRRSSVLGFTRIDAFGYWSPLTDGVVASPSLVFDGSGDAIAVWTDL